MNAHALRGFALALMSAVAVAALFLLMTQSCLPPALDADQYMADQQACVSVDASAERRCLIDVRKRYGRWDGGADGSH